MRKHSRRQRQMIRIRDSRLGSLNTERLGRSRFSKASRSGHSNFLARLSHCSADARIAASYTPTCVPPSPHRVREPLSCPPLLARRRSGNFQAQRDERSLAQSQAVATMRFHCLAVAFRSWQADSSWVLQDLSRSSSKRLRCFMRVAMSDSWQTNT